MTRFPQTRGLLATWLVLSLAIVGCKPAEKKPDAPADKKEASEPAASNETPPAPETKTEAKVADAAPKKVLLGSDELFASIPGEGALTEAQITAWLANPKNHEPLDFELPLGLAAGASQVQGLDKNPLTRAKIELGRQLYFDTRLSNDRTISCASCHDPAEGFAKHTQFGIGVKGQMGDRNSPVSYNRILSSLQFWDGRADSLEAQAVGPIANPIEMGNTHDACVECLKAIPGYKQQFDKIFGKFDIDAVGMALASFERAIVSGPTPFDYYEKFRPFEKLDPADLEDDADLKAKYEEALAGAKAHPLSDAAKRGRELYFTDKANCSACHVGANLTDEKYHNIGVGMDREKPDIGREEVTKDAKDRGAFKTPTIRNVALSAPYMHDGSQKTLEEVVEWYAKGGHANPNLSEKIKKLDLTAQDKADLVEFMKACTGDFPKINVARLPE
jgi:cytochrome c peroxidase